MITGSGEQVENGRVTKQNHLLHTSNQKRKEKSNLPLTLIYLQQ
jgi:hypothetical protein